MNPQVIITLTPAGELQLELPGVNGARRRVELGNNPKYAVETISRILHAQLRSEVALGLDGAPTEHQVCHWQKHAIFRDPSCPFCKAELSRARASDARDRKKRARLEIIRLGQGSDQVIVRRIPTKTKGKLMPKAINASLEEIGL